VGQVVPLQETELSFRTDAFILHAGIKRKNILRESPDLQQFVRSILHRRVLATLAFAKTLGAVLISHLTEETLFRIVSQM